MNKRIMVFVVGVAIVCLTAARVQAYDFYTYWNTFTSNFDYYALYGANDNLTAQCINMSGDQRCVWPSGSGAGIYYNFNSPIINNTATNVSFNESATASFKYVMNGTFINYLNASVASWNSWASNYTACSSSSKLYFDGRSLACNADEVGAGGVVWTFNQPLYNTSTDVYLNATNQTAWDRAYAYATNGSFINYLNSSVGTWNQANGSWNETKANSLYIATGNSSVGNWNKAYSYATNGSFINYLNSSVSEWNKATAAFAYTTNGTFINYLNSSIGNYNKAYSYTTNGTFINYLNSSISTWNQANGSWNETRANDLYIATQNTSVGNWNKAYSYTTNGSFINYLNSSISTWNQANGSWNQTLANTLYISVNNASVLNQTATDVQCGTSCVSDAEVDDTITASNYVRKSTWTDINDYPAACAGGTWVTTIGDTNTCSAPTAADVDPGTYPSGNYIYQGNVTSTGFKLADNDKAWYGTDDDCKTYFNGTAYRIECGTTIFAVIKAP